MSRPKSEVRQRTELVAVRCTPEEKRAIEGYAATLGVSVGALLRNAGLALATADGRPSITCPQCERTSWHPDDIRNGYCGGCHAYTGEMVSG